MKREELIKLINDFIDTPMGTNVEVFVDEYLASKTDQETNEQPKSVSAEEIRDKYSRQWFNETDDIDDPNTGFMAWPDVLKAMKEYENSR